LIAECPGTGDSHPKHRAAASGDRDRLRRLCVLGRINAQHREHAVAQRERIVAIAAAAQRDRVLTRRTGRRRRRARRREHVERRDGVTVDET